MLRWILPIIIIVGGYFAVDKLKNSRPEARSRPSAPTAALTVNVSEIEAINYQSKITAYGRIQPTTSTRLTPLVSGTVIEISDKLVAGQQIKKGDKLVQIDPIEYEIALRSAQASVAQARSAVEDEKVKRELALADWRRLGNKGAVPDRIARKAQQLAADAQLDSALAQLERAQMNLERTTIVAPYDATILKTEVGLSQLANNSTLIAEIYPVGELEIRLPVSRSDLALIGIPSETKPIVGTANVSLDQDYSLAIEIKRYDNQVDATTGEIILQAQLSESDAQLIADLPLVGQWVSADLYGKSFDGVIAVSRDKLDRSGNLLLVQDGQLKRHSEQAIFVDDYNALFADNFNEDAYLLATSMANPIEGTPVHALLNGKSLNGDTPAPKGDWAGKSAQASEANRETAKSEGN